MSLGITQVDCEIILEKIGECSGDEALMNGASALGSVFFTQLRRIENVTACVSLSVLLKHGSSVLNTLGIGTASINAYSIGFYVYLLAERKNMIGAENLPKALHYMSYYERYRQTEIKGSMLKA